MKKLGMSLRQSWVQLKNKQKFRNLLVFLTFVAISAVFWIIMSLNENVQTTYNVGISIYDTPDSVTFITDVPERFQVTVRDKGTNLLRRRMLKGSRLEVNFKEFASDGVLNFPKEALYGMLRNMFGSSAQISSVSIDSLSVTYTTNKGRRVPIEVEYDVTASSGNIVAGRPVLSQTYAYIYSRKDILDTITKVRTQKIVRRNLSETLKEDVRIIGIKDVRIEPSTISVEIPIEPLVNKSSSFKVTPVNVPEGKSVLLFPERIIATYFVPMSKYNEQNVNVEFVADYSKAGNGKSGKIPVIAGAHPSYVVNIKTQTDSLEYTVVK